MGKIALKNSNNHGIIREIAKKKMEFASERSGHSWRQAHSNLDTHFNRSKAKHDIGLHQTLQSHRNVDENTEARAGVDRHQSQPVFKDLNSVTKVRPHLKDESLLMKSLDATQRNTLKKIEDYHRRGGQVASLIGGFESKAAGGGGNPINKLATLRTSTDRLLALQESRNRSVSSMEHEPKGQSSPLHDASKTNHLFQTGMGFNKQNVKLPKIGGAPDRFASIDLEQHNELKALKNVARDVKDSSRALGSGISTDITMNIQDKYSKQSPPPIESSLSKYPQVDIKHMSVFQNESNF